MTRLREMSSTEPSRRASCSLLPGVEYVEPRPPTEEQIELPALQMRRSRSLQRLGTGMQPSPTIARQASREPAMPSGAPAVSDQSKGQTPEEQRFERMMERFQLRRVSISSGSPASSGAGRRNSMDYNTMGLSARRTSLLPRLPADDDMDDKDPRSPRVEMLLEPKYRQRSTSALLPWVKATLSTTCTATSVPTRVRLCLVATVFMARVLYMPFLMAYNDDKRWSYVLDASVDAVFLLNILAVCNTQTTNAQRQIITSRRAIWRHYRRDGFVNDLFAAFPWEHALMVVPHRPRARWFFGMVKLALQFTSLHRHALRFHFAWSKEVMASDTNAVASMLFSRYSHLVRIGQIVISIMLVAHYFACMWSWLHVDIDPDFFVSQDLMVIHLNSIYTALQLLQGQGMETKTPGQALFGSIAVLLGSIALAVMFGNVAVLVANFSASATAYQQRMEHVFAIMGKLELPHAIRERVHQYYEHLRAEYELLDGEIVKFAEDLSHTLTLETVLFRYMDVLVNVPHWQSCSPDFQKQLVLSLNVRVYLPDDFIMRRGEVGAECYLINSGTCKLCEYPTGNDEPPTPAMATEAAKPSNRRPRRHSVGRGGAPLSPHGHNEDLSELENGQYSRVTELTRGQAIGDFALLANYERSSDLRAVTYVEVCVIDREAFQRILTRYPQDRRVIVTSIVGRMMKSLEAQNVPCMMMNMVQQVAPQSTVEEAIQYISQAMDVAKDDPSIVFGVSEQLLTCLRRAVENANNDDADVDNGISTRVAEPVAATPPSRAGRNDAQVMSLLQGIQERLGRVEVFYTHWAATRREVSEEGTRTCDCHHSDRSNTITVDISRQRRRTKPIQSRTRVTRRRTSSAVVSASDDGGVIKASRPAGDRQLRPISVRPAALIPNSPSLYADQLFSASRVPVQETMENGSRWSSLQGLNASRRSSFRRLNST